MITNTTIPRRACTFALVALGTFAALTFTVRPLASQQPAAPRAPIPVTRNFTGTVNNLDASDMSAVRFEYAAGARSYWHVHTGNQVIFVERGRGRAQVKGQMMQDLVPGQPVVLPAGVPHWHGAAPDQGLVQIVMTVGTATFMDPVSEAEYLGSR